MHEILAALMASRALLRCSAVGEAPSVVGKVWVHGEGAVVVGDRVVFDAASAPIELHACDGATIVLGDDCRLDGGSSIEATRFICIGARCRLGAFCKVMDSHFHSLQGNRHEPTGGMAVVLEDDVVLGPWSAVLAGARVGRGTHVGAATVIRRAVPAGFVVRGSPPTGHPRSRSTGLS